jgi:hypothetical protein
MDCEDMKKYLSYSPETGLFHWILASSDKTKIGDIAGCLRDDGYIKIKIFGKNYLAHRLAWLFTHGEWPKEEIDHINRVRNDNRIENLRSILKRQQQQNMKLREKSTSGFVGVSQRKNGKWRAHITIMGKFISLGVFDTPEAASNAYLEAKAKHHELFATTCDAKAWAKAGSRLVCGDCDEAMVGEGV